LSGGNGNRVGNTGTITHFYDEVPPPEAIGISGVEAAARSGIVAFGALRLRPYYETGLGHSVGEKLAN
jgi:hypothetical protein